MASTPAISVIIPLYDAEEHLAECLNSIMAQTFKDFEVILINDGSTDGSRQIADDYLERFGGRLKIYDHEKNLGASAARNKGLILSHGEYIFFADSDGVFKRTALEELNNFAKDFDAEVVYCERFLESDEAGENIQTKVSTGFKSVAKPKFEPENLAERLEYISIAGFLGVTWNKLVRRDFLLEKELFFLNLTSCEDYIWTLGLFFFAKKFLRVPNANYVHRLSQNSVDELPLSRQKRTILGLDAVILGIKTLNQMMNKVEFLKGNTPYRYRILEKLSLNTFERLSENQNTLYVPSYYIYWAIKDEFGDKLGEQDALISVLCSLIDKYQKIIEEKEEKIAELEEKLKAK
ncbi:MAG: glycosyltransferase [Selenomonadaceae bacterium]|nr:glycosyltransferase [Selenomonadaceae bacterium]